ncbi:MAG TPA: glycoside hydrolase family 31 protein, partial [Mesotoga sp.]|nr:glycoside hydrolase family 31 protein [Mesotoga sp.]
SPYIYRESLHAAQAGLPLTLPLLLIEKENDPEGLTYMFGRDMVVSPAVDEEMKERKISLPEGHWVNLWNGRTHSGQIAIDGERTEVFLRKGSVIPLSIPPDGTLFGTNWSQEETGLLYVGSEFPENLGVRLSSLARRLARISGVESGIIKIEWREIR